MNSKFLTALLFLLLVIGSIVLSIVVVRKKEAKKNAAHRQAHGGGSKLDVEMSKNIPAGFRAYLEQAIPSKLTFGMTEEYNATAACYATMTTPNDHAGFRKVMDAAVRHGAVISRIDPEIDRRLGMVHHMSQSETFLEECLRRVGVTKITIETTTNILDDLETTCNPNQVVFMFPNLAALHPDSFLTRCFANRQFHRRLWVGLATEHLNHRLGAKESYIAILNNCNFVMDMGFLTLHQFKKFAIPSMWFPHHLIKDAMMPTDPVEIVRMTSRETFGSKPHDVVFCGKLDKRRSELLEKLRVDYNLKVHYVLNMPNEQVPEFINSGRVMFMMGRDIPERNNFEVHRWATAARQSVAVVCGTIGDNDMVRVLGGTGAIEFVPDAKLADRIAVLATRYVEWADNIQNRLEWINENDVMGIWNRIHNAPPLTVYTATFFDETNPDSHMMLPQPVKPDPDPRVQFIAVSNSSSVSLGDRSGWRFHRADIPGDSATSMRKMNRIYKHSPWVVAGPDCNTLYVDSTIKLEVRPYVLWYNLTRGGKCSVGMFHHWKHNLAKLELEGVVKRGVDPNIDVAAVSASYESYVDEHGMVECGVIARSSMAPGSAVRRFQELWLSRIMTWSIRDQVSVMQSLVETAVPFCVFPHCMGLNRGISENVVPITMMVSLNHQHTNNKLAFETKKQAVPAAV